MTEETITMPYFWSRAEAVEHLSRWCADHPEVSVDPRQTILQILTVGDGHGGYRTGYRHVIRVGRAAPRPG